MSQRQQDPLRGVHPPCGVLSRRNLTHLSYSIGPTSVGWPAL